MPPTALSVTLPPVIEATEESETVYVTARPDEAVAVTLAPTTCGPNGPKAIVWTAFVISAARPVGWVTE